MGFYNIFNSTFTATHDSFQVDNIEVADRSTVKKMTYAEAKMYCFCLGEGWRLPTYDV